MSRGPEPFPFAGGRAVVVSRKAPHRAGDNQDAAIAYPVGETGGVLAVADGAGGMPGGDQAARLALESLSEALFGDGEQGVRERILRGLETAHERIAALGIGAGTTIAVAHVEGREVHTYHVGDSVILVVGQRGKRKHQSIPHSPVGYAVESGLLDERDAIQHEDLHLVSSLLGVGRMKLEMSSGLRLAARDTLVIASDGLFDNLRMDEVIETVRKGALSGCMERLLEEAHRRMVHPSPREPSKPDDLTVVLFRPGGG